MTTGTMELWKRSTWLSNAAQLYAKSVFKDRWIEETKETVPWITRLAENTEKAIENGLEGMAAFSDALTKAAPKPNPNADLLAEATTNIIWGLNRGVYRGFGFDRTRTLETEPVAIPKEAWSNNISFHHNELKFQSLQFIDVRVRMVAAKNDSFLHKFDKEQSSIIGRPSFKEPIMQAFQTMYARGEIDLNAPLKSHWPKMRQQLIADKANLPKPVSEISDETFRRYLSSEVKHLKKTNKQ